MSVVQHVKVTAIRITNVYSAMEVPSLKYPIMDEAIAYTDKVMYVLGLVTGG